VHTPLLTQMMATEFLNRYSIDDHIESICEIYRERCGFMLDCLDKYMPDYVRHTNPEGGLFVLCYLPEGYNSVELLKIAIAKKVAFVPGNTFMIDIEAPSNCFRLNFSSVPCDRIEYGVKMIAEAIKEYK